MLRVVLRVCALLASDVAAFLVLRTVLRALRAWHGVGATQTAFIRWLFAQGYLGGWQFAAALLISLIVTGNYGPGDNRRRPGRLFAACALATALPLWASLWNQPLWLTTGRYVLTVLPTAAIVIGFRLIVHRLALRFAPHPHAAAVARTILAGRLSDCLEVESTEALARDGGFNVLGFVDVEEQPSPASLGSLADLDDLLVEHRVDTIILCGTHTDETIVRAMRAAHAAECQVLTTARRYRLAGVRPQVIWRRGQPYIVLRSTELRWQQLSLKRLLDVVVAGLALLILSPVMAVIAIIVQLDSPGPVIFKQQRVGRRGRPFAFYKFRSMCVDAERRLESDSHLRRQYIEHGFKVPAAVDPRLTRVGRFLRRTSLDELPQLWNVLKGDMSLVGPRPIVLDQVRQYYGTDEAPLLLSLRPGITGAWQVNGRSTIGYPERAILELEYIEGWSLLRDILILVRTLPAVLSQRGAH